MRPLSAFAAFSFLFLAPLAAGQSVQDALICPEGASRPCGTSMGACEVGTSTCVAGHWGECQNEIGPIPEICPNGIDDDCSGTVDDCGSGGPDFGIYLILGGGALFLFGGILALKEKLGSGGAARQPY